MLLLFLLFVLFPQCLWLCQLNVCKIILCLWSSISAFHLFITVVNCTIQSHPPWELVSCSCHHLLYYVTLTMIFLFCILYKLYVTLALNQSISKFCNSPILWLTSVAFMIIQYITRIWTCSKCECLESSSLLNLLFIFLMWKSWRFSYFPPRIQAEYKSAIGFFCIIAHSFLFYCSILFVSCLQPCSDAALSILCTTGLQAGKQCDVRESFERLQLPGVGFTLF